MDKHKLQLNGMIPTFSIKKEDIDKAIQDVAELQDKFELIHTGDKK